MINWKFCPQCKRELKLDGEYPQCPSCKITIYLHSSPTASVLIYNNGQVLLPKRGIEPFKGEFDIVGGFLKYGEDPIDGVIREAKEETGLEIKILDLLGIYMDTYGPSGESTLNVNYVGEIVSGELKAQDDVAELVWCPIDNLPKPAFKSQLQAFKDLKRWVSGRGGQN